MSADFPRRRLKRADRRMRIEQAAAALFAERGYAATRLEDIAAAAGITKQLLYQHFPSKQALQLDLLATHRDELLGEIAPRIAERGTAAERIRRTVGAWFSYVEQHPYAARLLFRDTTGDPVVQAFHLDMQARARAANLAVLSSDPDLHIPEAQLEPLAELIRSAMVGLALWWAEHPDASRELITQVATDALTGAVGVPRTPT